MNVQTILEFIVRLADSEAGDAVLNSAYDLAAEGLADALPDVTEDILGEALVNIGQRLQAVNE